MRKWVGVFLVLAMFAVFSFGCGTVSKDTKVKCPTCGAIYPVEEGLAEITKKGY